MAQPLREMTARSTPSRTTAVTPRLTTLRQPCEQLAQTAFQMLVQRIQAPELPPRETLLDAELVVRASTTTYQRR